jgi:hypothetical protein
VLEEFVVADVPLEVCPSTKVVLAAKNARPMKNDFIDETAIRCVQRETDVPD